MSRTPVLALTILLKKMARKSMLVKRLRPKKAMHHDAGSISSHSSQGDIATHPFPAEKSAAIVSAHETPSTVKSNAPGLASHTAIIPNNDTTIRDFAYPVSSPFHHGEYCQSLALSLSDSGFNGCHARVLHDYAPKSDQEVAIKAGDKIWIQYRISPGYFVADVNDETGLVPESAVELIMS